MLDTIDRRAFATCVTSALALVGLPASVVIAQLPLAEAKRFTDALQGIVRVRFGKHLKDTEIDRVVIALLEGLGQSQALARYPLKNGDDPGAAFRADLP